MLFIYRNFESLLYPLGFAWAALTIAAIVAWRKKQIRTARLTGALSLFLYLIGSTPFPEYLVATLEKPYRESSIANAPRADIVIVLGGFIDPSARDAFGFTLNGASDRIVAGVELLRVGKSTNLYIGGGLSIVEGVPTSEGAAVEKWLRQWNVVPGSNIIGLPACRNTREEAIALRRNMERRNWTNAILVTSASHMTRALATFKKEGINAHPVACDFEGFPAVEGERANWRLVPMMDHLNSLSIFIHEIVGRAYYKLRGWI